MSPLFFCGTHYFTIIFSASIIFQIINGFVDYLFRREKVLKKMAKNAIGRFRPIHQTFADVRKILSTRKVFSGPGAPFDQLQSIFGCELAEIRNFAFLQEMAKKAI